GVPGPEPGTCGLGGGPREGKGRMSQMKKRLWRVLALLLAMSVVAAACGDDDDGGDAGTTTTAAADGGGDTGGDTGGDEVSLDTNGDGEVVFGIAAAGPRDDGAYY